MSVPKPSSFESLNHRTFTEYEEKSHAQFHVHFDEAIQSQDWDQAEAIFQAHPKTVLCGDRNRNHGYCTKLHWLCSMGATPIRIIELVALSDPSTISIPDDDQYGDTCIHILCRNAQTSAHKVAILLQILKQTVVNNDEEELAWLLQRRNRFGGTALHSAANHNAVLEALRLLVSYSHGRILKVTTHDGIHAVTALWSAYTQTIPGHMKIVQILQRQQQKIRHSKGSNDEDDDEYDPNHPSNVMFERFWTKVEYLATQYFALSQACPIKIINKNRNKEDSNSDDGVDTNDSTSRERYLCQFVLHGLLQCNVPIQLFQVCLQHRPLTIWTKDAHGNTPLHVLLENRPYRLKEGEAVKSLLSKMIMMASETNGSGADHIDQYPVNHNNESPLEIALQNKIPFDSAIHLLITVCPNSLRRRDPKTGLHPFLLAAHVGGGTVAAVDTTFRLLLAQPDLIVTSGSKKFSCHCITRQNTAE